MKVFQLPRRCCVGIVPESAETVGQQRPTGYGSLSLIASIIQIEPFQTWSVRAPMRRTYAVYGLTARFIESVACRSLTGPSWSRLGDTTTKPKVDSPHHPLQDTGLAGGSTRGDLSHDDGLTPACPWSDRDHSTTRLLGVVALNTVGQRMESAGDVLEKPRSRREPVLRPTTSE